MATLPAVEADPVAEADLATHKAATKAVHGIADTSELATKDELSEGGSGLAEEAEAREDGDAAEESAREAADAAEVKARGEADVAETKAREAADSAEKKAREEADNAETTTRQEGDAAEQSDREAADETLTEAASAAQATADAALPKAGGTMTGLLTLAEDPKSDLDAATRQFVLAQYAALVNGAPEALDTLKELGDALKAAEESEESALEALTALVETKLSKAANLSDLADAAEARTHLGLGSAATKAAGAAGEAGKVLNADDVTEKTRAEAAEGAVKGEVKTEKERAEEAETLKLIKSENLKDLGSASTARTNLGLGTAATKDAGAAGSAGKVLNADDPTTSDTRTPKAHAASHKTAGSDPLAAADIGAAAASHSHAQADITGLVAALEGKQASLGFTPENVANKDTDTTLAANSDTKYASQKAVKAYIDGLLAASDAVLFKGVRDCSGNPKFPAADAGHLYRVSVAGKIGGASGVNVEVGDTLLCNTDGTAEGTQAEVGSKWNVIQVNIDGAVVGPSSATSGSIASFEGTTGKTVKDSGVAISTDGAMTSNSDAKTPTEKATKTYADTKASATDSRFPQTAVLTAEVGPIKEQTTLQNITGLGLAVGSSATERWLLKFYLLVEAANITMDLKLGFSAPEGVTGFWGVAASASTTDGAWGVGPLATAARAAKSFSEVVEAGTLAGVFGLPVYAVLKSGGKAGTVQIKYAQQTSNSGNLSILGGSVLEAQKVAS